MRWHHHLLGGLRGDAAEVVGRDVELVAVRLAVLVELLGDHADLAGVGVDRDPGVLVGVGQALVGRLERVGERAEERVDRDALLGGERCSASIMSRLLMRVLPSSSSSAWCAASALPGFGAGPHSKTVRARSMSS